MIRPIQILLIDDDPAVRRLTTIALETYVIDTPYFVTELENGAKAIDYISTISDLPDIILLDINMPVMNGFEFLRAYDRLQIASEHTVIYVLSTLIDDHVSPQIENKDMVKGYLEKPLTEDHIRMIMPNQNFKIN